MTEAEELELLELEAEAAAGPPSATPVKTALPMSRKMAALKGVQDIPTFGWGDEAGAGIQASLLALPPSVREALGGSRYDSGDIVANYERGLKENRSESAQARADQPEAYYGAGLAAALPVAVAMPGFQAARGATVLPRALAAGANGVWQGALAGAGTSETDSASGLARDTLIGGATGGVLGGALPLATRALGEGAGYLGSKAKDIAGWLKVNSIHPTPVIGEKMAELPGGVSGVGKELLERGVGGLTKKGTATQAKVAADQAGAAVDDVVRSYETGGGKALDLTSVLDRAEQQAADLYAEPTTRAAGERLGKLVSEYRNIYGGRQVPASEALALKRTLGKEAYGAGEEFAMSKARSIGDYGQGVAGLERGVDETLDTALGPDFGAANLTYRRLLGASDAAKRDAARGAGNKLVPLVASAVGLGGTAMGQASAIPAAVTAMLAGKYGSQIGARTLYGLGGALERGRAASVPASVMSVERQALLAELLRRRPNMSMPADALAMQEGP